MRYILIFTVVSTSVLLCALGRCEDFGRVGYTMIPFPDDADSIANSVAIDAKNRIYLAGQVSPTTGTDLCTRFGVARLTPKGMIDKTFGNGGTQVIRFTKDFDVATACVCDAKGLIVVGSCGRIPEDPKLALCRFLDHGIDKTFGGKDGLLIVALDGDAPRTKTGILGLSEGLDVTLLNEDIIVCGRCRAWNNGNKNYNAFVARFDTNGKQVWIKKLPFDLLEDNQAVSVAIQRIVGSNDKIIVSGTTKATTSSVWACRLHADGSLDKRFGNSGTVRFSRPRTSLEAVKCGLQSNGELFVAGAYDVTTPFVLKLGRDGNATTATFMSGDEWRGPLTGITVAASDDYKTVSIRGSEINSKNICLATRFNRDGKLDHRFGNKGSVMVSMSPTNSFPQAVTMTQTGMYLIAGWGELNRHRTMAAAQVSP